MPSPVIHCSDSAGHCGDTAGDTVGDCGDTVAGSAGGATGVQDAGAKDKTGRTYRIIR